MDTDLPVDLTTRTRLERIGTPFPTQADFAEGGRFAHLAMPFFPPVPIELLKYLYGNDVTHNQVSTKDQAAILRSIHEQVTKSSIYCGCGRHILKKNPAYNNEVGSFDFTDNVTSTTG